MKRYTVGIHIEGYKSIDISNASNIKDSIVIIFLDSKSNGQISEYYKGLKQLIINGNKTVIIMLGEESSIRKQLCMLMASYEKYEMYTVDQEEQVTDSYIEEILKRSPTEEEVETYIDADIKAYTRLNETLIDLRKAIQDLDQEKALDVISNNMQVIENSVGLVDYMKRIVDHVNSGETANKIKTLEETIDSMKNQVDSFKTESEYTNKQLNEKTESVALLQKDITILKNKLNTIEKDIKTSGPVITTYGEVQTSLHKCRVKSIIYFKEITYIRYANSLVYHLVEVIRMRGLKVKLLIYDDKKSFNEIYKGINTIAATDYINNKEDAFKKPEKVLVIEPHPAIIEDVIQSDYDVVIVYDRLKQTKDIVVGNCVYKYWVLNSRKEYEAINRDYKINPEHVITRPGVVADSIALIRKEDYAERTPSAKLHVYLNLANNNKKIFDSILDRTNISAILGAKKA